MPYHTCHLHFSEIANLDLRAAAEARLRRIAAELDGLHRSFGAVWHVNCHSMPAVGDANADDPGRARADFVLGDRDGTTCAPEFTALVADVVRGMGYSVAINDPYKGVEIVRRHGRPAARRHSPVLRHRDGAERLPPRVRALPTPAPGCADPRLVRLAQR